MDADRYCIGKGRTQVDKAHQEGAASRVLSQGRIHGYITMNYYTV